MHAPRIQLITTLDARLEAVRAWAGPVSRLFLVVGSGAFAGRHWLEGDVIVCRGAATEGSLVVLEARGLGRPRLGSVAAGELHGEMGEVCSGARWGSAGEVGVVLRPASGRQSCGLGSVEGAAVPGLAGWRAIEVAVEGAATSVPRAPSPVRLPLRVVPPPVRPHAQPAGQLALFARAA